MDRYLVSTISGERYPFDRVKEFADNGEALEVGMRHEAPAIVREGRTLWERFVDFAPFISMDPALSLGEGNTPLLASPSLAAEVGLGTLLVKCEGTNPTGSFKDRGTLPCVYLASELGEPVLATISTGNMGASVAAYAGRAGMVAIVFVPSFCPMEKMRAMSIHGATIIKVAAPDYSEMKRRVLDLATDSRLRVVSGNGPIRTEGYKYAAFEMHEQLGGQVPDFVAVPTSACGHIRGIFKGYIELRDAGLTSRLPRMIVVQAANNSPLVTAFRRGERVPVPFRDFHTIAEAITTGNPMGGDEILDKAYKHDWLMEDVTEDEILDGQRRLARAGFFVEPASATLLPAVGKLRAAGAIGPRESVVLMLTGSGLKDAEVFAHHRVDVIESSVMALERDLTAVLDRLGS